MELQACSRARKSGINHTGRAVTDILLPDCKLFADKLAKVGTRMSYTQAEGMFHCWPLLRTKEGLSARADMAALVTSPAGG